MINKFKLTFLNSLFVFFIGSVPFESNAQKINDNKVSFSNTETKLITEISSTVSESSAIKLADGKLWTLNDAGNPNAFYSIDSLNGNVLQTVYIDNFQNTDWEEISADKNYLYIGDFGNNAGTRSNLKILKIAKKDIGKDSLEHVIAKEISFSYTDQVSYEKSKLHNFDCEAMINIDDSIFLFTKNRGDLQTRVYSISKNPGNYFLKPISTFDTKGLITGADYDPVTKEIVLVGYVKGHSNSFIWKLNDYAGHQFFSGNKIRIEIGNENEWQTEGICFRNSNSYYISCEKTKNRNASLYLFSK